MQICVTKFEQINRKQTPLLIFLATLLVGEREVFAIRKKVQRCLGRLVETSFATRVDPKKFEYWEI